jgi:hypothetical protein
VITAHTPLFIDSARQGLFDFEQHPIDSRTTTTTEVPFAFSSFRPRASLPNDQWQYRKVFLFHQNHKRKQTRDKIW